jgi:octopine/nopaline transport system substrate-binding protein
VIDIRQYKTTEQHDLDLAAGRVDGVFASISYLKGVVEEPQNKEMMFAGPRYGGGPLGFGVAVGLRKGDPELQAKFDAAVGAAVADGTVKTMSMKVVRLRHHPGTLAIRMQSPA